MFALRTSVAIVAVPVNGRMDVGRVAELPRMALSDDGAEHAVDKWHDSSMSARIVPGPVDGFHAEWRGEGLECRMDPLHDDRLYV